MNGKRAQTAVELLSVYGWVVLLILIAITIAYYSGYFSLENMLPPYCSFTSTLNCYTFKFGYMPDGQTMALTFKLTNGLGYDIWIGTNATVMTVENIGKLGKNNYAGNCTFILNPVRQGDPISCTIVIPDNDVVPTANRKNEFKLSFTYGNCNVVPNYSQTHNCAGAPNYTVSGQIRAQLESNLTKLYACGDGVCDYSLGENPTNCCSDCPISSLTLTAVPSSIHNGVQSNITAYATYHDGSPVANVAIIFDKKSPPYDSYDEFESGGTIVTVPTTGIMTDSTGMASILYDNTNPTPPSVVYINASTCGAVASTQITIGTAPPNGTIIFTQYPALVPAGNCYSINVTVYNTSGGVVPGAVVSLTPDRESTVTPNATSIPQCETNQPSCVTNSKGIVNATFCSNFTHVGRIRAMSVGIANWTNPIFGVLGGQLLLWVQGGSGLVGSEGSVNISGCLYDTNGQSISDATITLTTDLGYFESSIGDQKLPNLKPFQTWRPVSMSDANAEGVRYEAFATDGENLADPIEYDVFAGKFVKILGSLSNYVNSTDRSTAITDWLRMRGGTAGRRIEIFYNSSYNTSDGSEATNSPYYEGYVYAWNTYSNLTQRTDIGLLNISGMHSCNGPSDLNCFETISNPYDLKNLMLTRANITILISANEYFPVEVWNCETDGGVPRKFFQRGGIQIFTGRYEYAFKLNSSGGDSNRVTTCPNVNAASQYVFSHDGGNWANHQTTVALSSPVLMHPVLINKTFLVITYAGGCFNVSTSNSVLYSHNIGVANITATYYTVSNSTLASFNGISCGSIINGSCDPSNQPHYCINGYLADRCYICGCSGGYICDSASGSCVNSLSYINLTVNTFNGTGSNLPNDNYTLIQVIAQVVDSTGNLIPYASVSWSTTSNLMSLYPQCTDTDSTSYCGDTSALPTPASPRAAVYVMSAGGGNANITATATAYGITISNSINVSVYTYDFVVGKTRWRTVTPTLMPADGYTDAQICISTFNLNDSALGNVSVCFNTTLGVFDNGLTNQCFRTDNYGQACASLQSTVAGNANVTVNVTNCTSGCTSGFPLYSNVTYYLYTNITFYQIPTSIIITPVPTLTPCAQCSGSSSTITATVRDASNNPIAGIPYVYFWIPKDSSSSPAALVWYSNSYFNQYWWGGQFGLLKPGYYSGGCPTTPTGTCSNPTGSDGSVSAIFKPVYPPGLYPINVSVWYNCDAVPFSPDNCHKSVSNVTLINVSPVPKTFIISPVTRLIKPNGMDNATVNTTLYGSGGNPLTKVWCWANWNNVYDWTSNTYIVPSPSDTNAYGITNSSAQCSIQSTSDVPGNFTLQFQSAYFNLGNWVYVNNYTTVTFGPMVGSITIDKSTDFAYADGRVCPTMTIGIKNSNGQPMENLRFNINPLRVGANTGVIDCPVGNLNIATGLCSGLHTDASGMFSIKVCSSYNGTANFSLYVGYSNATNILDITNSTIIFFAQPPTSASMTVNTSSINNTGTDIALFTAQFRNDTGPTPGIPVNCSVSENAVFYPSTNLFTDSNGKVYMNLSANSTPATMMCTYIGIQNNILTNKSVTVTTATEQGFYKIDLKASQYEVAAGTKVAVTATVTHNGNLVNGVPISFATSYAGGYATLDAPSVTTTSGVATDNVTMSVHGAIFVKAYSGTDFNTVKIQYD